MAIRMSRFMTGRTVNADDARALVVKELFTGEMSRAMYLDFVAVTRGTGFGGIAGQASSFPDQFNEANLHGLYVPWHVAVTHGATDLDAELTDADTASAWDQIFRNLLFEWEANGNEYYGGDADADPITFNQEDDTLNDNTEDPSKASAAERGSLGPLGIQRLVGSEVWLRNMVSDGDGKTRQGMDVSLSFPMKLPGPAFIIIGMIRYEHAAETNFNAEYNSAARRDARNMLIGGDLSRVQKHIEKDSGSTGDYIRTVLFGGDAYIEADTVKGESLKAYAKGVLTVETPYQLQRF